MSESNKSPSNVTITQMCTCCRKMYPLSEFGERKNGKGNYTTCSKCREERSEKMKKRYKKNLDLPEGVHMNDVFKCKICHNFVHNKYTAFSEISKHYYQNVCQVCFDLEDIYIYNMMRLHKLAGPDAVLEDGYFRCHYCSTSKPIRERSRKNKKSMDACKDCVREMEMRRKEIAIPFKSCEEEPSLNTDNYDLSTEEDI